MGGRLNTVETEGFSVESTDTESSMKQAFAVPQPESDAKPEAVEPDKIAPVAAPPDAAPPDPDLEPVDGEADAASAAGKLLSERRGRVRARIDAATREKNDAKRDAEAARAELAAFKAREIAEPKQEKQEQTPQAPAGKPRAADFDNYEDFVEALADFKANERVTASQARFEQAQASRGLTEAQNRVEATAKAAYADFDTVIGKFASDGKRFSPFVADVILNHPLGHTIAYELAKDDEAHRRLSSAPNVVVAGIEMGRFIAQLETAKSGPGPVVPSVTSAKPPIKPVGSSPVASDESEIPDDLPFDQYYKRANAQELKARRR